MPDFRRYAIYDPGPAPLAAFGAAWLGWDPRTGRATPALAPGGVADVPRRYGFHATIKAPFRLAPDASAGALVSAFRAFCQSARPVRVAGGLALRRIGDFVALVPAPQPDTLASLAAQAVIAFEPLRAPLTAEEMARRKPETLTAPQKAYLERYGYPYVMDEFRYHMTLSGPLSEAKAAALIAELGPRLDGLLSDPHPVGILSLMGEDDEGRFHQIEQAALGG